MGLRRPSTLSWLQFAQEGAAQDYDPGGIVIQGVAGAALVRGEAVYLASSGKFLKSTTQSLYKNALVGIVVGGQDSNYYADHDADGGAAASADTEKVLVCVFGVCDVIADAAMATIGVPLMASNGTAGQVEPAAEGNQVLGILLETAGAQADTPKAFINPYVWGVEEDTTS